MRVAWVPLPNNVISKRASEQCLCETRTPAQQSQCALRRWKHNDTIVERYIIIYNLLSLLLLYNTYTHIVLS